ncbi:MAG: hypothetical protein ACOY90_22380 [Candidatus Zhuqueibacterota bacterium]
MNNTDSTILIFSETAGAPILKSICEDEKLTVETCSSLDALRLKIQQRHSRLALIDLTELANERLSALHLMCSIPMFGAVPIIVLAFHIPTTIDPREYPCLDFLKKPFHRNELTERIRCLIQPAKSSYGQAPSLQPPAQFSIDDIIPFNLDEQVSDRYISSDSLMASMSDFLISYSEQSLTTALLESNLPHCAWNEFSEIVTTSIQQTVAKSTQMTLMRFHIDDAQRMGSLTASLGFDSIYSILFSSLEHCLRTADIVSVDLQHHAVCILLPHTHLKMAKIIGSKIQHKIERHISLSPFQIRLASYPQDGSNALEVMAMLDAGLEKVESDVLI